MKKIPAFLIFILPILLGLACTPATTTQPALDSTSLPLTPALEETAPQLNQSGATESAVDPAPTTAFDSAGLAIGPGQGFIPLDDPVMIPAAQATWLEPDEIVLGVQQNGESQAFPISQMAYHHIVNTTVGGEPYLVTY